MSTTTYTCHAHNWIGCLLPCPMCAATSPEITRATHPTPCPRRPARGDLTQALQELADMAEWYVRCLDDVRARRPVRGLDEAEAGYATAMRKAREALKP